MAERKKRQPASTSRTCKQITALLLDFLNDRLTPTIKREFARHLRVCPDCVRFLNTYKKTVAMTGTLRTAGIPSQVRRSILQFLRSRARSAATKTGGG